MQIKRYLNIIYLMEKELNLVKLMMGDIKK